MKIKQLLLFILFPFILFSQTQVGSDIDGEAFNDESAHSVSISSDGSVVAIGAPGNDGNGTDSGHVRIYQNISGVWTQIGSDIDGEASGDGSGSSVSLNSDGSIVAIGAPGNDGNGSNSGNVRIYQNISGVWTQIGSDIDGEASGDLSGRSVSLSSNGSIVAIGAERNDGNGSFSGHVRIYQNISGVWTQIGSDIDGEASGDQSGFSVSLSSDGSFVAIGAPFNNGNGDRSGHVRVYDLNAVLSNDDFVLSQFNLYPNPINNQFIIQLNQGLLLEKVNIYNNLGQFVHSTDKTTINVSGLSQGVYFVKIITDKGEASKRIIIK